MTAHLPLTAYPRISRTSVKGFTLPELMLSMGIVAVLFSIATILLSNLIPRTSLFSQSEALISDLRQQQTKAMVGETEGAGAAQLYGIKVEAQKYTLFKGAVYDPLNPNNYVVPVSRPLQMSTTFPSQIVQFNKGSGEVVGYGSATDTITITNVQGGNTTTIELNRYGVISSIN